MSYVTRTDSGTTTATEDWITDFSPAEGDRIDLSALSPLRPLVFVGTAAFTGVGQVRARYDGGETLVEIDLGGDATPDMVIRLSGRIPLSAGDFKPSAS
ncbi:M10 family metallopeptidase C-terminal domain-containing protein [Sphingomonas sp. Leaf357]|uniref:M10 family metallopeptidase C-terminal domain-containing protein n=1 Tax=Sphingomonas sp. Leaf357 TaxID=1736350 RepID=UPI0012E13992|nr:M10 family metallopeptidase C-terminal domain-containing protein [Sphingomonas sp. Leaf357]